MSLDAQTQAFLLEMKRELREDIAGVKESVDRAVESISIVTKENMVLDKRIGTVETQVTWFRNALYGFFIATVGALWPHVKGFFRW